MLFYSQINSQYARQATKKNGGFIVVPCFVRFFRPLAVQLIPPSALSVL